MPAAAVVIFASFKAAYVPEYINALVEAEKLSCVEVHGSE